ncbi:MAG: histidine kinase [Pseudobdellovibrionaceae bacterium]
MKKDRIENLRPFFSVFFVIATLFLIVFFQMEERRVGYSLLKLNHESKKTIEEKRTKAIQLAKVTRPQFVERVAQSKFELQKMNAGQIIHLTGSGPISSDRP